MAILRRVSPVFMVEVVVPRLLWTAPVIPMETAATKAMRNKKRRRRRREMGPFGGFFARATLERE